MFGATYQSRKKVELFMSERVVLRQNMKPRARSDSTVRFRCPVRAL